MAKLARDYHHNLLSDGLNTPPEQRAHVTEEVLTSIHHERKLKNAPKDKLTKRLTHGEVLNALKVSNNGKATRVNDIPYELWKKLNDNMKHSHN
jgi:hypothetical protein